VGARKNRYGQKKKQQKTKKQKQKKTKQNKTKAAILFFRLPVSTFPSPDYLPLGH